MSVTSLGGLKLADGDEMGPAETNPFVDGRANFWYKISEGPVEESQCSMV